MWQKGKQSVISAGYSFFALLLLVGLTLVEGCGDNRQDEQQGGDAPQVLSVDSVAIPVFDTPEQQLHFGQSFFEEPLQKQAALQAVCMVFPKERKYCGVAALDLVYLSLGADYRTASKTDYTKAVTGYRSILKQYVEYKEVAAKASWYLGWLHCDLLGDKETGLRYYKDIVDRYSDVTMHLDLPIPEVSSLYSTDNKAAPPTYSRSVPTWATVALVEIARNATAPQDIHFALHTLANDHDNSMATGMAIKTVVQEGKLPVRSKPIVELYLSGATSSLYLKQDIQAALFMGKPERAE